MTAENQTNMGCHERALTRALAGLQRVEAPGLAPGLSIALGTLVRPGAGIRGRYVRGDAETWQDTANHLERVAAGWTLAEVGAR